VKVFAKERGLELNKMLLAGGSAGAHLSLLYAYQKADISPIEPVAVCSFSGPTDLTDEAFWVNNPIVDGIINMVSPLVGVEFTEETYQAVTPFLKQASPILYASKNSPPTVILHGVLDDVVPHSNAVRLYERLTQLGVTCDFLSYPNSGHGLESDPNLSAQADELMVEYAETYLV
jgi:dipeptidyl aminopeptidase/acylaminoacyl peptidase